VTPSAPDDDDADAPPLPTFKRKGGIRPARRARHVYVRQHDEMDCGAACLAMMSKAYGRNISLATFRARVHVTREGASMWSLVRAARQTGFEVVGVQGEDGLESIDLVHHPAGIPEQRPSDGLFVFIGATAESAWLPSHLIRDQWGYVCTGRDVMDLLSERPPATWPLERDPYLLETSIPGVLAAGESAPTDKQMSTNQDETHFNKFLRRDPNLPFVGEWTSEAESVQQSFRWVE
jgi:hypothetical protein